jgi:hypothetical protein
MFDLFRIRDNDLIPSKFNEVTSFDPWRSALLVPVAGDCTFCTFYVSCGCPIHAGFSMTKFIYFYHIRAILCVHSNHSPPCVCHQPSLVTIEGFFRSCHTSLLICYTRELLSYLKVHKFATLAPMLVQLSLLVRIYNLFVETW